MIEDPSTIRIADIDHDSLLSEHQRSQELPANLRGGGPYRLTEPIFLDRSTGVAVFARTGGSDSLGIDLSTGEVIFIGRVPTSEWTEVESPSLDEFIAVAEVFRQWWRSVDETPSDEVDELRRLLTARNFESLQDPDGYWRTLVDCRR